MKKRQRRGFDLRQLTDAIHGIVGVDEAGRGALAGPVVAGAVLINRPFLESDWCRRHAGAINDSKQLNAEQRDQIYERMEWLMRERRLLFAAGSADVAEIETENILGATRLAMRRAIESVLRLGCIEPHPPDPLFVEQQSHDLQPGQCITDWLMLVDGRPMKGLGFAHRGVVEGDTRSLAIAMGSIVAKVTRDRLMMALDGEVPGYGFAQHKGYATPAHRSAILAQGPCIHHRQLFLRSLLHCDEPEGQERFVFEVESESFDESSIEVDMDVADDIPVESGERP